jgi:arsenite-transporting ATPase
VADSLGATTPPANLEVLELDAAQRLEDFKREHGDKFKTIAERGTFLDKDDVGQFLDRSLPGMDELMAFLEISKRVESKAYRCVVVDTAPTGHTLRLLAMPVLLRKWLGALDVLLAKHRYMKSIFSRSPQPDEIDTFLTGMLASVKKMQRLLRDPKRAVFVPVMLAEMLSIDETSMLLRELAHKKVPVSDIIVNRLYPASDCPVCSDIHARQFQELKLCLPQLSQYVVWAAPLYPEEVQGVTSLNTFWKDVVRVTAATSAPSGALADLRPLVEFAPELPSKEIQLVLFAGKGGVGKTTLACATALRLAQDLSERSVFLFSTDPAHSLSACWDRHIGSQPTSLTRRLSAMEIDAQAEFKELRNAYEKELAHFIKSLLGKVDLKFDREVMERIMDLSPPGIDEIMALTLVMDLLSAKKYDVFVLDCAPTGHLIRLLELPQLIDDWLKTFFGLFAKYGRIFRLPKIFRRMTQISAQIQQLRKLFADPSRSTIYGVSILTEMSFEETKDLVGSAKRLNISLPVIFHNLATAPSSCSLCSALVQRESKLRSKFLETFPSTAQPLVYRRGEPRGLTNLEALGQVLYQER